MGSWWLDYRFCIFRITIHTNLKIVNFLDVTQNLSKGSFEPYKKKMSHQSTYTRLQTTHLQLSNKSQNLGYPIMLQLSGFLTNTNIYDKALKYSGYRQTLPPKGKPKHRNSHIILFNSPNNICITSNIGRDFLKLITN